MNLRSKITILILLMVAGVWLFGQLWVLGSVTATTEQRVESALNGAVEVYAQNQPSREVVAIQSLKAPAGEGPVVIGLSAEEPELISPLNKRMGKDEGLAKGAPAAPDETKVQPGSVRHQYLFLALQDIKEENNKISGLIVTDVKGMEWARTEDGSWHQDVNWSDRELVKECLAGHPGEDIWEDDRLPVQGINIINCHPVTYRGDIIGSLVMIRPITEAYITRARDISVSDHKVDIALWGDKGLIASTLPPAHHKAFMDYFNQNRLEFGGILMNVAKGGALKKETLASVGVKNASLDSTAYRYINTPFFLPEGRKVVGMTFLYSWDRVHSYVDTLTFSWLIFCLLVLVLGLIMAMVLPTSAYKTVDFIMEGANKIILGNKDYKFESKDPYLDSIGQTLNVMSGMLSGNLMPEDEDESLAMSEQGGSGPMKESAPMMSVANPEQPRSVGKETSAQMYAVNKDSYYETLFKEFVKAKAELGEDVSAVSKDRFIQKLENTETKLIEKYNCSAVRFEVQTKNNKVSLAPIKLD